MTIIPAIIKVTLVAMNDHAHLLLVVEPKVNELGEERSLAALGPTHHQDSAREVLRFLVQLCGEEVGNADLSGERGGRAR